MTTLLATDLTFAVTPTMNHQEIFAIHRFEKRNGGIWGFFAWIQDT